MSADVPARGRDDLAGVRIAILGCGAVGRSLATELGRKRAQLVLWSRTRARAEELAARLASPSEVVAEAREGLTESDVVLVCVTDGVLADFVSALAEGAPAGAGERAVLHTNGFHGRAVLAPLEARGWSTGKLHPLASVPPGDKPGRLRGAWFACAADRGARPWLDRLLAAVDGRELPLGDAEEDSRAIHAAASLLSGGLVALFEVAAEVARSSARDPDLAERALLSLLASTSGNLWALGPRDALTGPAARGALDVVTAHLATLEAQHPAAAELYRLLGRRMAALAEARGSISPEVQAALDRVLSEGLTRE